MAIKSITKTRPRLPQRSQFAGQTRQRQNERETERGRYGQTDGMADSFGLGRSDARGWGWRLGRGCG